MKRYLALEEGRWQPYRGAQPWHARGSLKEAG